MQVVASQPHRGQVSRFTLGAYSQNTGLVTQGRNMVNQLNALKATYERNNRLGEATRIESDLNRELSGLNAYINTLEALSREIRALAQQSFIAPQSATFKRDVTRLATSLQNEANKAKAYINTQRGRVTTLRRG